jgi:hypothetical protein
MSSSTIINTTNTSYDQSNQQAGALSLRGNNNTSNVNLTTTDYGAVAGGLNLGNSALATTENIFNKALGTLASSTTGAQERATQAISEANQRIASAYNSSTGSINSNALIMVGIVGAVVVFFMMRKR